MSSPLPSNRKWYTILGGIASVVVIAGFALFVTLSQLPQQSDPSNTNGTVSTPVNYPLQVQTNFLNGCKSGSPSSVCQCSLSWFEQNVPVAQFQQDEAAIAQGGRPADMVGVEQACG